MFVPRDIPGAYLKDHIDKWHFCYPSQLSTAAMVYTVSQPFIHPPATISSARAMTNSATTYKLLPSDRIATLEAEILSLKAKQAALICSRTQKLINLNTEESRAKTASSPLSSPTRSIPQDEPADSPIFTQKQVPTKHISTLQPKLTDKDLPITITQEELLSLTPAVQFQLLALVKDKPIANSALAVMQHLVQSNNPKDNSYINNLLPFAVFTAEQANCFVRPSSPVDLSLQHAPELVATAPEQPLHFNDRNNPFDPGVISSQFLIAKINCSVASPSSLSAACSHTHVNTSIVNFQPKPITNHSDKWRFALDIIIPKDSVSFNLPAYFSRFLPLVCSSIIDKSFHDADRSLPLHFDE